jgi:hypothetical protein
VWFLFLLHRCRQEISLGFRTYNLKPTERIVEFELNIWFRFWNLNFESCWTIKNWQSYITPSKNTIHNYWCDMREKIIKQQNRIYRNMLQICLETCYSTFFIEYISQYLQNRVQSKNEVLITKFVLNDRIFL